MKRAAVVLLLLAMPVFAGWQFSPPIEVGAAAGKKIFADQPEPEIAVMHPLDS